MHISRQHNYPFFQLNTNCIEVWCIETAAPSSIISQLKLVLSADERQRADRFQFEPHRNMFIVAHGVLRKLLRRYIGISDFDITFAYGPGGKPSLPDSRVEFNISHTDGVIVLAFAQDCPLGVDVERIRPVEEMMQIASRYFCSAEAQELGELPEAQRERAFFLCWTRKEAYIKAIGKGLSIPLSEFRVTLRQEESARFLHIDKKPSTSSEWALYNLEISADYAAALAHRGAPRHIVQSPFLPAVTIADSTYPGSQI